MGKPVTTATMAVSSSFPKCTATSGKYIYNGPGNMGEKWQLNWQTLCNSYKPSKRYLWDLEYEVRGCKVLEYQVVKISHTAIQILNAWVANQFSCLSLRHHMSSRSSYDNGVERKSRVISSSKGSQHGLVTLSKRYL